MNPIAAKFVELDQRREKALVLFVTAGDPSLDDLPALLDTLVEGGADIIEVGIPFSDPIGDGPTIQASSQRALDAGVTQQDIYNGLATLDVGVPVVAMGYYNSLLRQGLPTAAANLVRAKVSGTIIVDLTPEESDDWSAASRSNGLDNIFLAAPTSTDARLDAVCRRTTGFVYAVSRMGVTSQSVAVSTDAQDLVRRIRARTKLPICVGFGISKPKHVRMVCEVADGAVVGSALVDLINREWKGGMGRSTILETVRSLNAATRPLRV